MRWTNTDQRVRRSLSRWDGFDNRMRRQADMASHATRQAFVQFEIDEELVRLKQQIGTLPVSDVREKTDL